MSDEAKGERIAKVMARAGVASRRDAEKMILAGRVTVNGAVVASPALDVLPSDKVTLDGKPIDAPQPARLWLYYKPIGLVTSEKDEKGRQTVFDTMPEGMPRVMSVGRLDLTSEGLLLLTNDGELKRRLELPSTGWLRKYRVRVNGRPNEATFDPLRRGVEIEGETFLPMEITLDKQQGANAWLTVGLREGKNREIRRAMAEIGLTVNRLIRVSYGPFRLNTMKPGDVVEVKARILREQLGDGAQGDEKPERKPGRAAPKGAKPKGAPFRKSREDGDSGGRDRSPRPRPVIEDRPDGKPARRPAGSKPSRGDDWAATGDRPRKPRQPAGADNGERPYKARPPREGAASGDRPYKAKAPREGGSGDRPYKARPPREGEASGDRPYKAKGPREGGSGDRPYKARPPREGEASGDRPFKAKAPRESGSGDRPYKARPPRDGEASGDRPFKAKTPREGGSGDRPYKARGKAPDAGPRGPRPTGDGQGPKPGRGSGGPSRGKPGGGPRRRS